MRIVSRRLELALVIGLVLSLGALMVRAVAQASGFDPRAATVGNARLLTLAVRQYAQDYDERLPSTRSVPEFQAALQPYVGNPAIFIAPETGQPFVPNPAISGQALAAFGDLGTVEILRDTPPRVPPVVAFLDGHVERRGVEQGDPNAIIVGRASALAIGVLQYTQDNEEVLPPMQNAAAFQAAIGPYVRNVRSFNALNGSPFIPNAALSGAPLATVPDRAATPLLQDSPPYVSGMPTIAYLDGHVTHGTLPAPRRSDVSNLRQLLLAALSYEQDNQRLPPTADQASFQQALMPYLSNASFFDNPDSGLPYVLNPAVGGRPLSDFPDPATTELLRDPRLNSDGTFNTGLLDGHIQTQTFFLPTALATGADGLARLFWSNPAGEASLWTLAPTGATLTQVTATLPNSVARGVGLGGDGLTRLVWATGMGAITLTTLDAAGVQQSARDYGPYDGWSSPGIATGANNESRLLWRRYDGTYALWRVSPAGDYLGDVRFLAQPGRMALGLSLGADGQTRLLWRTANGAALLWTLSPADRLRSSVRYLPHAEFTAIALALGPDDRPRLLWDNGAGQSEVWTLPSAGSPLAVVTVPLGQGFSARSLSVSQGGGLTLLAAAPDGTGRLLTLLPDGTLTGTRDVAPYQ